MMRRKVCALAIITLLATGSAFAGTASLPQVHYVESCSYMGTFEYEATDPTVGLMPLLSIFIEGMPDYYSMDLEASMAGDGIPDYYQLALLGQVLCAGDPIVMTQFNHNKVVYNQLVADVTLAVNDILGPPRIDARVQALVDILDAHPELLADSNVQKLRDDLAGLVPTLQDLLGEIPSELLSQIPTILTKLSNWSNIAAAIAGLSTEMQSTVTNLLADVAGDVTGAISDVQAGIAVAQAVVSLDPPVLTPAEITTVNGDIAMLQALIPAVNRTMNLGDYIAIYGTTKSASEPFSAAGDYDGDGVTNLAVYQAVPGIVEFIPAVSGADPFWGGNPGLPVAGLLGLAALASAMGLGGALSIRKK